MVLLSSSVEWQMSWIFQSSALRYVCIIYQFVAIFTKILTEVSTMKLDARFCCCCSLLYHQVKACTFLQSSHSSLSCI